ncbi:MAG: TonB family protein, partial [Candidatus Dadabacteria bacterium]
MYKFLNVFLRVVLSNCWHLQHRRAVAFLGVLRLFPLFAFILIAPALVQAEVTPPQLEVAADIVYPEGLSQPVTGVVTLRFAVTTSGTVTDVAVLESNHPAFVPAVVEALRQSRFRPALRNGEPFQALIETTIEVPPPPAALQKQAVAWLRGVVYEKGSRRPIAGAEIAAGADAVTTSDSEGRFALPVPPGAVTVTVAATGFELARFDEQLRPDEALAVEYRLQPRTISPLELIVEAEYERTEVSRVRLDTRELRSVPGTFDDAIRVVQKLPGVAQSNEFSGDLLVRGSDARDTVIYIDGVPVPFVFHFGAIKSVIATDIIADVTLYPSNFSVRYGDAIGGVLNVRIRDPRTDRWQGRALISTLLSEAVAEGPAGRCGGVQIGARSSYAHLFLDKVIPENAGVSFSTLPKFRDYQFRYTCNIDRLTLRTFIFGAQDELTFLGDRERTLDPDNPFNRFAQQTNEHSQSIQLTWSGRHVTGTTLLG